MLLPGDRKSIVIDNTAWITRDNEWVAVQFKEEYWTEYNKRWPLPSICNLYFLEELCNSYYLVCYWHSHSKQCVVQMSLPLLKQLERGSFSQLGRPSRTSGGNFFFILTSTAQNRDLSSIEQHCSIVQSLLSISLESLFLGYINVGNNRFYPLSFILKSNLIVKSSGMIDWFKLTFFFCLFVSLIIFLGSFYSSLILQQMWTPIWNQATKEKVFWFSSDHKSTGIHLRESGFLFSAYFLGEKL